MANKNSLQGLVVAIILIGISFVFYKLFFEKKDSFLLDNPTTHTYIVFFNKKEYILAPGQSVAVSINKGANSLSFLNEKRKVIKDTVLNIINIRRGVINPTHSIYYSFRRYYGGRKNIDSIYKANKHLIDGKIYFGDIKENNDILIQDFYYNINESFDLVIKKTDSLNSRVKLFRKNQFLDFYKNNFE